ncbi:hypothetical protein GCM10022280_21150 [Sphingomonas swuensis]|uniref:Uncharacterized protein n=1 Tax=Sphingomonas swuensis TaxID=977800 RepID=A0ABP7T3F2_9SPHN
MFEQSRRHLDEAGESYFQHMRFALTVAALAIGAGLGCLVHAIVPALCEKTCSRTVAMLQDLFRDRSALADVQRKGEGVLVFTGLMGAALVFVGGFSLAGGSSLPTLVVAVLLLALPLAYLLSDRELAGWEALGRS